MTPRILDRQAEDTMNRSNTISTQEDEKKESADGRHSVQCDLTPPLSSLIGPGQSGSIVWKQGEECFSDPVQQFVR